MTPRSITLNKNKKSIQIEYSNNKYLLLNSFVLRIHSPSAENKNSKNKAIKPKARKFKSVLIEKLVPVGNYAIRIIFNDGHNTGIYSWTYLYNLGTKYPDS